MTMLGADTREGTDVLLDLKDLTVQFAGRGRVVHAVDGVSLQVFPGEIVGVAGESGCGKSSMALAIPGLLPPTARVTGGTVQFLGRELLGLPDRDMRQVRGKSIGMIFQDPTASLNPVLTVGHQVEEVLRLHLKMTRREAQQRTVELFELVGIPNASRRLKEYPYSFSGGMRQRVMIAMALACSPKLVLADEPTTALDATTQAQVLELLRALAQGQKSGYILITHDLSVIAEMAERAYVMYAGRIVESGYTSEVLGRPRMPYTWGLLKATPRVSRSTAIVPIDGQPPDNTKAVTGCRFAARCRFRRQICEDAEPPLRPERPGSSHHARCWGTQADGWLVDYNWNGV
jgi:oligopeptide/dipeptide ABC transporter ATP-binding protein